MSVSSRAFSMRPRIGDAPAVEIAMVSGLRSTIEGMMKSPSAGLAATLTSAPAAFAASRARRMRRSSSVAIKQSAQPRMSSAAGSRASCRKAGLPRNGSNSSLSFSANTITVAPARIRSSARRAAASPPPTMAAGLPVMSMKIGKLRMEKKRRPVLLDGCEAGPPRAANGLDVAGVAVGGSTEYGRPSYEHIRPGLHEERRGVVRHAAIHLDANVASADHLLHARDLVEHRGDEGLPPEPGIDC